MDQRRESVHATTPRVLAETGGTPHLQKRRERCDTKFSIHWSIQGNTVLLGASLVSNKQVEPKDRLLVWREVVGQHKQCRTASRTPLG